MFYDTLGAVDGKAIMRLVHTMLRHKGVAETTTFRELHERTGGVALVLTGYNVRTLATDAFDHVSHPDMPVALATRITISIPLYFRPIEYDGQLYIDGGVIEPTPTRFCRHRRRSLVIVLTCCAYGEKPPASSLPMQMPDFVSLLLCGPGRVLHRRCLRTHRKHASRVLNIAVPPPTDDSQARFLDLDMDTAAKDRLFGVGEAAARKMVEGSEVGRCAEV